LEPPDTLTAGDRALAACVVLVGVAAGLVWASGQLAGLIFGHTWLHLDPAEVAGVLWHLPRHWSYPALAWPAAARGVLPGPVGMYASFVVVTTLACALAGGVLWLWRGAEPSPRPATGPGRSRRQPQGSAAWAGRRELKPLRVRRPEPGRGGLPLGPGLRPAR
jgi:hypothetical protein